MAPSVDVLGKSRSGPGEVGPACGRGVATGLALHEGCAARAAERLEGQG